MENALRLLEALTLLLLPHVVLGERKCRARWLLPAAAALGAACFLMQRAWLLQLAAALVLAVYVLGALRGRAADRCFALALTLGAAFALEGAAPLLPHGPKRLQDEVALLLCLTALLALSMAQGTAASALLFYPTFYLGLFLAFLVYRLLEQERQNGKLLAAQIGQMQAAQGDSADLQAVVGELRRLRHDLKHHLQVLCGLLEQGQEEAARAYRREVLGEEALAYVNTCASGCAAVDALLLAKAAVCKRNAIELEMKLCALEQLPLSQAELCAVLGNLLDNAIEACLKIPAESGGRQICFSMQIARRMLHISCRNALVAPPKTQNGRFLTSKPGQGHGDGIESIRSIVERADGRVEFSYTEAHFFASVLLALKPS